MCCHHFRLHNKVTDTRIIDLLVFKGITELQEIEMQFKQRSHITRLINPVLGIGENTTTTATTTTAGVMVEGGGDGGRRGGGRRGKRCGWTSH